MRVFYVFLGLAIATFGILLICAVALADPKVAILTYIGTVAMCCGVALALWSFLRKITA